MVAVTLYLKGITMDVESTMIAKLKRVKSSGLMYLIIGRIVGEELASVEGDTGAGITFTADGQALIGDNIHVGSAVDLRHNVAGYVEAADLDAAETGLFWSKFDDMTRLA